MVINLKYSTSLIYVGVQTEEINGAPIVQYTGHTVNKITSFY